MTRATSPQDAWTRSEASGFREQRLINGYDATSHASTFSVLKGVK